jgi:hypothetical protein
MEKTHEETAGPLTRPQTVEVILPLLLGEERTREEAFPFQSGKKRRSHLLN